jgi:hypothetical protein
MSEVSTQQACQKQQRMSVRVAVTKSSSCRVTAP